MLEKVKMYVVCDSKRDKKDINQNGKDKYHCTDI